MKITPKYGLAYVDSKGIEHQKPEFGTNPDKRRTAAKVRRLNAARRILLGKYIVIEL